MFLGNTAVIGIHWLGVLELLFHDFLFLCLFCCSLAHSKGGKSGNFCFDGLLACEDWRGLWDF